MKNFIQSLSLRVEFIAVVGAAFGYPIVIAILRDLGLAPQKPIDMHHLVVLLFFEAAICAVLVPFLWLRGWRPKTIGLRPTLKGSGAGLLLLVLAGAAWVAIWYATYFISPATLFHIKTIYAHLKGPKPPLALVLITSAVNAAFEEIFVAGYIITTLRPIRGPILAVAVSTTIRVAYHLYQGPMAVLGILPLGLIYATWYVRSGRLWPLIVAHALQDIAALAY